MTNPRPAFPELCGVLIQWSGDVSPKVQQAAELLRAAFAAHAAVISAAESAAGKPADLSAFLAPLTARLDELSSFAEANRRDPNSLFIEVLRDTALLCQWTGCAQKPVAFIKENAEVVQFSLNKVLRLDKRYREWVGGVKTLATELQLYVTDNHSVALKFGGHGAPAATPSASSGAPTAFSDAAAEFAKLKTATVGTELGDLASAVEHLVQAARVEEEFLQKASQSPKPSDAKPLLEPIMHAVEQVSEIVAKNDRHKTLKLHFDTLNEAAQLLRWVNHGSVLPATFVDGQLESFSFYCNKLLTQTKGNAEQNAWAKQLSAAAKAVAATVKASYKTGVTWRVGPAAPAAKLPPPPPPPPPPKPSAGAAATSGGDAMSGVFDEIRSKGLDISKGLRHVSDDQKVYKQKDREVKTVTVEGTRKKGSYDFKPPATGTAKMQLEGDKKWQIEYHQSPVEAEPAVLEISPAARNHGVNILRCSNVIVRVPSKVNTISLVECAQVQLDVDATVGPIEVTSSHGIELLVRTFTPSVVMSKVSGVTIHLRGTSLDTDIVTNCSSGVNVTYPCKDEDGNDDSAELAVPEIFTTRILPKNRLKTTPAESSG